MSETLINCLHEVKRLAYTVVMKLSNYLSLHGSQTELARAIGAQPQLIWQWSTGVRKIPIERCVPIERATNGAVTRQDLRPEDWQDIWPELATQPTPAESATQGA